MEAATGVALFSTSVSPGAAAHFDIDAFWRRVTSLEHPGPAPALDAADSKRKVRPSVSALQFKQRRALHRLYALLLSASPIPIAIFVNLPTAGRLLFLAASVGLYFVARMLVRLSNDTSVFADRARMDLEHFEKVRNEWQSTAGPGRFDAKRTELDRLRARWDESRDVHHRMQQERHDQKQSAALARFLDGFDIEAAGVSGLSPSRVPLLASFGIETAADIVADKLDNVPKLDKKMRDVLTNWRAELEAKFRREAGSVLASLDEELIEREALAEQMRIEAALRAGLQDLQEIQKQALFARISMKAKVEEAHRAYLQSATDLKAVTR